MLDPQLPRPPAADRRIDLHRRGRLVSESKKIQAIKGVRDILPPESALWSRVEQAAREVFGTFGFAEIRLPIFEQTELFARSVGVETDIVSKEMYSFEDKGWGELAILRD